MSTFPGLALWLPVCSVLFLFQRMNLPAATPMVASDGNGLRVKHLVLSGGSGPVSYRAELSARRIGDADRSFRVDNKRDLTFLGHARVWGTFGDKPSWMLSSVVIDVGDRRYQLPRSCFQTAPNPISRDRSTPVGPMRFRWQLLGRKRTEDP
jgi:hypothetical protein